MAELKSPQANLASARENAASFMTWRNNFSNYTLVLGGNIYRKLVAKYSFSLVFYKSDIDVGHDKNVIRAKS
jgi:hypothetical protein